MSFITDFLLLLAIVLGGPLLVFILSYGIMKFGTAGYLRAKERSKQRQNKTYAKIE